MNSIAARPIAAALAALMLTISLPALSKRVKTRLKVPETAEAEADMTGGTFAVSTDCKPCAGGYSVEMVKFSGFDKTASSSKESFFITNTSDKTLKGLTLYISYTDISGRQLHKRHVRLNCDIPPGETRAAEIPTWDSQHSFYYIKSSKPRKQATPFDVSFDPVTIYLTFD